jgi:hypothetical protein
MKPLTLYKALHNAEVMAQAIVRARGSNWGISVQDDHFALRYQRYERLSRKLDIRLREILGEEITEPLCWKCYYHEYACHHTPFEARKKCSLMNT